MEEIEHQGENFDFSWLGNATIDITREIQLVDKQVSHEIDSLQIRDSFRYGRQQSPSSINEKKYCEVNLENSCIVSQDEIMWDIHQLYEYLGFLIPSDMMSNQIEIARLTHPEISKRFILEEDPTVWSGYREQIVLANSDQFLVKIAFQLPESNTLYNIVSSARINKAIQNQFLTDHEASTYQTLVIIQRIFKGRNGFSSNSIDSLAKLVRYNDKLQRYFKGTCPDIILKTNKIISSIETIDSELGTKTADSIFKKCFNFGILKKSSLKIGSISIYNWFVQNWRQFSNESFKKSSEYKLFSSMIMDPKHGLNPNIPNHDKRWLFLKLDDFQKTFLSTFTSNLKKIKELFDVVEKKNGGFPRKDPWRPAEYLRGVYLKALNKFTSKWQGQEDLQVISSDRWSQSKYKGHGLHPHEISSIEKLTRFLVNTLFNGNLAGYNAFHKYIALNEMDSSFTKLYTSRRNPNFAEIKWLDLNSGIKYIGPRLDQLSLVYERLDEVGQITEYSLQRDSFDEGIAIFKHIYYVDARSNIRFVNPSLEGDTWLMIGGEKIRGRMMYDKRFQVFRKIEANEKKYYLEDQTSKRSIGDIFQILGKQYGRDVFKSFYVENAGMSNKKYLTKKPKDMYGLRKARIPVIVIVPDGKLGNIAYSLANFEKSDTFIKYYQEKIQKENVFSPVFDHFMYKKLARTRLKAQQNGSSFNSFLEFIKELRDPINSSLFDLTFDEAKIIVETFGINYESGNFLGDTKMQNVITRFWADFDSGTKFDPSSKGIWARLIFDILLQTMHETSGQIQLLMTPQKVQKLKPDLVSIVGVGSSLINPVTGTSWGLMNFFDPEFMGNIIEKGSWKYFSDGCEYIISFSQMIDRAYLKFLACNP